MLNRKCPRADELATMVAANTTAGPIARHVAKCETCTQIVANLRRDAELLSELRDALSAPPDEKVRHELVKACRSAVRESESN